MKSLVAVVKTTLIMTLFMLCSISCRSSKSIIPENLGLTMMNAYERMFSIAQFDSICDADNISKKLDHWSRLTYVDGETGKPQYEYSYIKALGQAECIYRLEPVSEDSVRITKRITK